ncbi:MAG: hypothetical protein JWM34_3230 [Ilumatobacteraceae bacterium]|nr:hypothetical protein [Ilumatobacteraceae bacterium]
MAASCLPTWRKASVAEMFESGRTIGTETASNKSMIRASRVSQWRYIVDLATPERDATASTVTIAGPPSISNWRAAFKIDARDRVTRASGIIADRSRAT